MRTTFHSVNRHTKYVITKRYGELSALQKQLATGLRVERPSDDPVAVANTMKIKDQGVQLKQYEDNMDDALSWMRITDTTMNSMNQVLQRGKTLAIQGDNDTLSEQERAYLAEEVGQLAKHLTSLVNTKFKGEYLFSGSHTDLPARPLEASVADGQVSYNNYNPAYINGTGAAVGSTFPIMLPKGTATVADHEQATSIIPGSVTLNVNGDTTALEEGTDFRIDYELGTITILSTDARDVLNVDFTPGSGNYNYTIGGPNMQLSFDYLTESEDKYGAKISTNSEIERQIEGGIALKINTTFFDLKVDANNDMIQSMVKLGNALLANDTTQIEAVISDIDAASNKILSAQSTNGAKINLVETTHERNARQQVEVEENISKLIDADYATVVSDFSVAQTVFNAALQSTAQIMQRSLADFIR